MIIKESFSFPKNGGQDKNEDILFIGDRVIAVVDGVTSKTAPPDGVSISGGVFASRVVADLLKTLPEMTDGVQIIEYLNEKLKQAIAASPFSAQPEPPAASVVLYDRYTRQVISYGDCQILLRGTVCKREKQLDVICAQKRADILLRLIENGESETTLLACDPGRAAIEADILHSFLQYANQEGEYGFPVLGYGQVLPQYVDIFPVTPGEEVVLASDGYPILRSTLLESETELERVIRKDPLLIREYPSTKGVVAGNHSYDDRTYVRFVAD